MIKTFFSFSNEKLPLLLGLLFLTTYWIWGYDGIVFSDEVTYLQLGHQLWSKEPVVTDYHFTSRWGAFLFSGFFTHLLGFSDRYASLATLAFYSLTLYVVWRVTPIGQRKWSVLFFIGNVFLLHFLTKVYPDGFLNLWVVLIPAAAIYRHHRPVAAASIMAAAFFIGFCTKETIVFLAPFPLILLLNDLSRKQRLHFYYYFGGISLMLVLVYLSYYQWQFGDWLYRFKSVNEGHYISEYTYHDKGIGSILKRITYLPILTFIDRTYWLWWVMAIPGIYFGIKRKEKIAFEFGCCTLCLLLGFWLMTSTLEFYNPIYLNPRHLIILVAPLSVCIALGSKHWLDSRPWKIALAILLVIAGGYSVFFVDWKIGLFYISFAVLPSIKQESVRFKATALCLILPVSFSIYYQHQLKNYPHLVQTVQSEAGSASRASPLLTHDFIYFSRDVILQQPQTEASIISLADLDSLVLDPPDSLTLLIYTYYRHAYPTEQEFLDQAEDWIDAHYSLGSSKEDKWISIRRFTRKKI